MTSTSSPDRSWLPSVRQIGCLLILTLLVLGLLTVGLMAAWGLLHPSGGLASVVLYGLFIVVVLGSVIAAMVFLARLQPTRTITTTVVVTVRLLLACGIPAGGWWTFAVDHNPSGA